MADRSPLSSGVLQEIRARIILSTPADHLLLHETELAKQYGVSRTPIRRMIQALVHEKLLTTQTGVGSVPVDLIPGNRGQDFLVYAQIARASAQVPSNRVTADIRMRMMGIAQLARLETQKTPELFVRTALESAYATSDIVRDPILSEALANARFRTIRWLVQDCRANPNPFWVRTVGNFDRAARILAENDPALYLETVADIVETMSKAAG